MTANSRRLTLVAITLISIFFAPILFAQTGRAASRLASSPCTAQSISDVPDIHASDLAVRLNSPLFHYIQINFGEIVDCKGKVTQRESNNAFVEITYHWRMSTFLTVKTLPPESSIIQLERKEGLPDEPALRDAMATLSKGIGLRIAWDNPEKHKTKNGLAIEYWDSDGTNVHVEFRYDTRNRLVRASLLMAL